MLGPGDVLTDEAQIFLDTINLILDAWNAERRAVYHTVCTVYTFTAGLGPHTIGPTGTFVATSRPVSIEGAVPLLSSTVRARPVNLRGEQWWLGVALRTLSTSIPTDLYYAPKFPNGELNFWPVPSTASQVEIQARMLLTAVALDTLVSLPPGYEKALMLTTAEDASVPCGRQVPAKLARDATLARAQIFGNNDTPRRIRTRDDGIPGGGGAGSDWRYDTGPAS